MPRKGEIINRVGEENYNTYGTKMIIVECKSANDIIVEFQDEYKYRKKCAYKEFKNGGIKNPYDKEVCGVGYIGVGKYECGKQGKNTRAYEHWRKMLLRCYDPYALNKAPAYIDCYVCDEWLCFQNFAKWFYKHYYEIEGEKMHLDKDILVKGNKIYSPETCVFVPERINYLFIKSDKARGKYPIGVSERVDKRNSIIKIYLRAYCSICDEKHKKKQKHLGQFPLNRPFQAFYTYKQFKESYIKQVADRYKELIPKKLYEAMYKWEVEIND